MKDLFLKEFRDAPIRTIAAAVGVLSVVVAGAALVLRAVHPSVVLLLVLAGCVITFIVAWQLFGPGRSFTISDPSAFLFANFALYGLVSILVIAVKNDVVFSDLLNRATDTQIKAVSAVARVASMSDPDAAREQLRLMADRLDEPIPSSSKEFRIGEHGLIVYGASITLLLSIVGMFLTGLALQAQMAKLEQLSSSHPGNDDPRTAVTPAFKDSEPDPTISRATAGQ